MSKRYKLIGDVKEQVIELTNQESAGVPSSLPSFENNLTYKKKYFCVVYGQPTSGKSEFVLQESLYLAREHGWKNILYTPETGDSEDIVANLIQKMIGKSVSYTYGVPQASVDEIIHCMKWLNNHFIIVETDEGVSMEGIFEIYDEISKDLKWKADNFVIDNHNDLLDFAKGSIDRQDISIEKELTYLRRQVKKRNAYAFLVTHTSGMVPITENGVKYYPIPDPEQIRGGRSWYRKGYMLVNLWRCPLGLNDPNGVPYLENQTILSVMKAKPRFTGTKGFQGNLYYNPIKGILTDTPPLIKSY